MTAALKNVTFDGASGRVGFNQLGNRVFSSFSITNLNGARNMDTVGKIINKVVSLNMSAITWPGATPTKKPPGVSSLVG